MYKAKDFIMIAAEAQAISKKIDDNWFVRESAIINENINCAANCGLTNCQYYFSDTWDVLHKQERIKWIMDKLYLAGYQVNIQPGQGSIVISW